MTAPTRRGILGAALGLAGSAALSACTSGATTPVTRVSLPTGSDGPDSRSGSTPATGTTNGSTRHAYGSDPSQFGELYRPARAGRAGVVVLIHGGFWLADYDLSLEQPLARDLVSRGYTTWNLEYRRVGNGGGWPATFADVGAGIDALNGLSVDTSHVVVIGHSAGGQLAAWAGGRDRLPGDAPGARPLVRTTAVVAQAGVLDLRTAFQQNVGGSAVSDFLGATPSDQPARYRLADPIEQVPLRVPVLCVHAQADVNVPYAQSLAYVAAARQAGATATLATVPGDHFTLIDPSSPAWATVLQALPGLFAA